MNSKKKESFMPQCGTCLSEPRLKSLIKKLANSSLPKSETEDQIRDLKIELSIFHELHSGPFRLVERRRKGFSR